MSYTAPQIDAAELQAFAEATLPHAHISLATINPDYESWRLEIKADGIWYEYFWGPLSGFGFTDMNAEPAVPEDIFAPYEIGLLSMDEAKECLLRLVGDS